MAKQQAVWGIDIGQSALKALRCLVNSQGALVADKFDYIEYPKILSSPEADPEELIAEALTQFLSRNDVVGDKVAISVPGQSGLSRFFKPPPVEVKMMPDIVKYEVKQQIPFPIEDVIWDWQQMGGTVVEGRAIDADVGLFAMKRDAVYRALRPFTDANIDVELVQLAPLALFNYACYDVIGDPPSPEEFDPENPPPSIAVLSIGTDTTDLVVTNGIKLWLRNIPIGGNHFTRQLSRELKLTQAKAEHLKRNARQAENPKEIFKAMRPVFNDLVNEVQRSLTFYRSIEKTARISEILLLGNASKLPGLRQFLTTQLEMDIAKSGEFQKLDGPEVTKQSTFAENLPSFAPCYGLCIQGLKKGRIGTNLLPEEIEVKRVIEAKKPWVLASVGLLMLGLVLGLFFKTNAMHRVDPKYVDGNNQSWEQVFLKVNNESTKSQRLKGDDEQQKQKLDGFVTLGRELSSASEDKASWIDIYSALYQALPKDPRVQELLENSGLNAGADPGKIPFEDRKELYIDHIDSVYFEDLGEWYQQAAPIYASNKATASAAPSSAEAGESVGTPDAAENPLTGKAGWVIEIRGHHFHNSPTQIRLLNSAKDYLMKTFIHNIETRDDIVLPTPDDPNSRFTFADIGISFPTIIQMGDPIKKIITYDPTTATASPAEESGLGAGSMNAGGRMGGAPSGPEALEENQYEVSVFEFVVQMAWVPATTQGRIDAKAERLEKLEQEQADREAQQANAIADE